MTICINYIVSTFSPVFCEDILYLEHYNWTIPGSLSVWTFPSTRAEIKKGQVQTEPKTYTVCTTDRQIHNRNSDKTDPGTR